VERLTLEEKVALLSGRDKWSLPAVPAIGLESIVMSDGPTGVKGDGSVPIRSPLIPCGTALAASWNSDLVEAIGSLLGETARANGVHVLLAPATNMIRSPLDGRNFEYYSEDPLLAGKVTCAYVRGVQSAGVAATVKHFVCNDAETHRFDGNVVVDEQPLRDKTVGDRPLRELIVRLSATLTPAVDGEYVFGVDCSGAGTLQIDGREVLVLAPEHDLDWSALFRVNPRGVGRVTLEGERPVEFELEFRPQPDSKGDQIGLVTLRAFPPAPADLRERAVHAAAGADVAVVIAGLGEEFESEGFDRSSLELPAEQLELISAVAAANPATVVVVSAGAQVLMDWVEQVPSVLLVWYPGQEFGDALGEVLLGRAEPGGRLPMTFPARPEDAPVLEPGPDNAVANEWHYREGLFVGYRHYDRHRLTPAYCFGHGLGYTTFDYEDLRVERQGDLVEAAVRVRNTGSRRGKTVVQLYVGSEHADRPPWELRDFRSIVLDAGAEEDVRFTLTERAFSEWNSQLGDWTIIPGAHKVAVGTSSRDLHLTTTLAYLTGRTAMRA